MWAVYLILALSLMIINSKLIIDSFSLSGRGSSKSWGIGLFFSVLAVLIGLNELGLL